MEPESETDFTNRIGSAIKIAEELLKETQEIRKVVNSVSKENLDPGISSSDEEVSARNLQAHTRKSVSFDPGIPLTPDALGKYTSSVLRKPKAISMLFPGKLHNDPSHKLSTDKNNTRGMGINIPTYSDELTADVTSLPPDHSRPSITGIPPALPKASEKSSRTETHSTKNEQVRLNSSRENLTYLKSNYIHFLSADCEFVTPVSRLLVDLGAVDPQDLKDSKPKIGEVLVTPRTHFNVYSLTIKQNHFEEINEDYIKVVIHNLRIALERENISEFRISKYGDISDALPKGKLQ